MDAKFLDQFKENIQPLSNGRPALKLAQILKEAPSRTSLARRREEFESRLNADDSDDPLQDYLDYISWIRTSYPLGNGDSSLLHVLERCTLCFRDISYYKNDVRYLNVWLSYAGFSDLPKDIFVYLAKKEIGLQLALYYEEFAKYLELRSQLADAKEVYEVGIEREARPLARLRRSFQHFKDRSAQARITGESNIRTHVLRQASASSVVPQQSHKRQKLSVHEDKRPMGFKEIVFDKNRSPDFALISDRARENSVPKTAWGEATISQKSTLEAPKTPKFEVFKDKQDSNNPAIPFEISHENGKCYTIIKQTGKPIEKLCLNLNLFYPKMGQEYCISELLAISAGAKYEKQINISGEYGSKISLKKPTNELDLVFSTQQELYTEQNHTFTIPLRDEETSRRPNSPTITMVSRAASNEVLKMFNDAAHSMQLEDELFKTFEESTDYEGYVTDTLNHQKPKPPSETNNKVYTMEAPSSPFMERPPYKLLEENTK